MREGEAQANDPFFDISPDTTPIYANHPVEGHDSLHEKDIVDPRIWDWRVSCVFRGEGFTSRTRPMMYAELCTT